MIRVMRRDLPSGTVTFLFTDVEGSTRLLHALGAMDYAEKLGDHRRIIREACAAHGGVEVDTQGDAFFVAFPTASGALSAAREMTATLHESPISVRIGIHTGTPLLTEEGYVGDDVHRAARIAAVGHGGQVLVSSSTAALVGLGGLRDLGEHRLKDLPAGERIYQLGDAVFPPLASLHPTNLPVPVSPFVGREREVADAVGVLVRNDVRLLTMTGPGGTGKTRLSLQVAAAAANSYPHGVWWVPLTALRDPRLVVDTVAQVLGARDSLVAHCKDRRMLIVCDNFEQVMGAAVDLADLLVACPGIDLLVTSREPLHINGEHEYPVPTLALAEGVELFMARARAVVPDFAEVDYVAEICRRLDCLPLAIELAAARMKVLTADQILVRLEQRFSLLTGGTRDQPERQRTLRGAFDWSHDLLSPDEQKLFRRLAVFRGGCTVESAETVAAADLDTLHSLVDKSLLHHIDGRFRMLESIRQYAQERLNDSGESNELSQRHAASFLALAEEAQPHLRRDSLDWLDRLEKEHDNLRAALDRLNDAGENQRVLQLAGALGRFWYLKSHLNEGSRRLADALSRDEVGTSARARALTGAGALAYTRGDGQAARVHAEEALTLSRQLDDAWGIAYSSMLIANVMAEDHQFESARLLYVDALQYFNEINDLHSALLASTNLATVTGELGDGLGERTLHEQNLRLARELGSDRMEADILAQLAMLARDDGLLDEAEAMLKVALGIESSRGDVFGVAVQLGRLSSVLIRQHRVVVAAQLLASARSLMDGLGVTELWWVTRRNEETLGILGEHLEEPALSNAIEKGRRLGVDEAVALALGTDQIGRTGNHP